MKLEYYKVDWWRDPTGKTAAKSPEMTLTADEITETEDSFILRYGYQTATVSKDQHFYRYKIVK